MIDIRARNFKNAPPSGTALKTVTATYTVRTVYSTEVKPTMPRTRPGDKPKMGRPRKTENVVRVSRGVRIDPALLERVNEAVSNGYILGATNFSEAVEKALNQLLQRRELVKRRVV